MVRGVLLRPQKMSCNKSGLIITGLTLGFIGFHNVLEYSDTMEERLFMSSKIFARCL